MILLIGMMYVFSAPILVWPGYEDTVLSEQRGRVTLERLALSATAKEMLECTDFEVCLYLSSASLSQPMSHTWTKLYTHVFCKAFPQHKELGEGIEKVQEYEMHELKRLKQWIYKKQMEAVKDKIKAPEATEAKPKMQIMPMQTTL